MVNQTTSILIGACTGTIIGFCVWLASLESDKMSGIIFRQNSEGNLIFTPKNILLYMVAPFKKQNYYFWQSPFLQHNWIVMTTTGLILGALEGLGLHLSYNTIMLWQSKGTA